MYEPAFVKEEKTAYYRHRVYVSLKGEQSVVK
jgi:hypothetical protein